MEFPRQYGECRCCLTSGYHLALTREYFTNGKREVYYDIFTECFNLFLSTNTNLTMLICASCVCRLKEASEFKSLVVKSECQLLQRHGNKDTLLVLTVSPLIINRHTSDDDVNIKLEQPEDIKMEPQDEDDDNELCYENAAEYNEEHEQPTTLAEPEQAQPPDVRSFIAKHKKPRCRPRPLPTHDMLYTLCPGYMKNIDRFRNIDIKADAIPKLIEATEYNSDLKKPCGNEKLALMRNASLLIENSNMTPFKSRHRLGFPCFYCKTTSENLPKLRHHQTTHSRREIKRALARYGGENLIVYVDVTDLECSICSKSVPSLSEFKEHLVKIHKKTYNNQFSDRVIPFKLNLENIYECQICKFNFVTFGSIERHMNVHYRNYVCKQCGAGFITKYRYKVHVKSMHEAGTYQCDVCKKMFTTQQKVRNHINAVHNLMKRFKCPLCSSRFAEYFQRQKHMVLLHNVAPIRYNCNVCDKTFPRRYSLSRHMKRDHLEERDFQCEMCSYKCFTSNELKIHMVKHNGERIFECEVCKKSYARKKTLTEHMRIHNNERRFACAVCGQAFVQKCSLKGHMKTHHSEYNFE